MSVQSDRQFFQRVGSRGIGPTLGDGTARGGLLAPTAYNVTAFVSPSGVSAGSASQVVPSEATAWVWLLRDTTQSIASGSDAIDWDTEVAFPEVQGQAFYSTLPTDTFTVPFNAMVTVEFAFGWSTFDTATDVQLEIDGTPVDFDGSYIRPAAAGVTWQQESMTLPLDRDTALRILVVQTSGSAQTLLRATVRVVARQIAASALSPESTLVLWHADNAADLVYELSTADFTVTRSAAAPSTGVHGAGGSQARLFSSDFLANRVYELDPSDFSTLQDVAGPGASANDIGGTDLTVWHVDTDASNVGTLYELDPDALGTVIRSQTFAGTQLSGCGGDDNTIWASEFNTDTRLREHSTADLSLVREAASPGTTGHGAGGDADTFWHSDDSADTVYEISTVDLTVLRSAASPSTEPRGIGGK